MGTERRTPRRPSRTETAARTLLVVALLATAAVGVSSRRGLDWDRISETPDVAVAQLLLGAVGGLVLVLAVRHVLKMLRREPAPPPEEEQPVEPRSMPWPGWLLAGLALAVGIGLVWLAAYAVLSRRDDPPGVVDDPSPDGGAGGVPGSSLPLLLGLLGAVAVAALLLLAAHRAARPVAAEDLEPAEPAAPDGAALAEALTAAGEALDATDDTRAAIVAAYTAMERSLARGGTRRRDSDTPTELLDRAVAAGLVSRGAALDLTDLFREARFSRHPLPETARSEAERALARVSAELAVRHA